MPRGFRKKIKDFRKSNKAASELIGTILLLGMAVALFSIVYISVLSVSLDANEPNPRIIAKIEGSNIILEHRGGDRLSLGTKVNINIQNEKTIKTVGDLLIDTNKDGYWNIGERLSYQFTYSIDPLEADIISVDIEGKKIILLGTLDIYPECDVGVEIFVDKQYPKIWDDIEITIKANHYNGDTNATNIRIEYIIPDDLTYVNYSSTQGVYNNETGIWNVGDIKVGGSATIKITATVTSTNFSSEPTQLAIILDGSTSISPEDWIIMKNGLAAAVEDPDSCPHDGTAEITVIQFGGYYGANPNAIVQIGPVVIDKTNFKDVADDIEDIKHLKGWTPMACGVALAVDTLEESDNFDTHRHVFALVTDGQPNAVYNLEDGDYRMEPGSWGFNPEHYEKGKQSTFIARNYLLEKLILRDEFDAIAVGNGTGGYPGPDIPWLRDSIVWPDGYEAPPFDKGPGWVRHVDDYKEFAHSIKKVFKVIFGGVTNTAKILYSIPPDPNANNDIASITIVPQDI